MFDTEFNTFVLCFQDSMLELKRSSVCYHLIQVETSAVKLTDTFQSSGESVDQDAVSTCKLTMLLFLRATRGRQQSAEDAARRTSAVSSPLTAKTRRQH